MGRQLTDRECSDCKITFKSTAANKSGLCKKCSRQKAEKKRYYQNRETALLRRKMLYEKHKDRELKYTKEYNKKNRVKIKERNDAWRKAHPNYNQEYYQENRDSVLKSTKAYTRKRRQEDPYYKMLHNIRSRVRYYVRTEGGDLIDCLGCTKEELKLHIQNQFKEGMNWSNYGNKIGQWSIDHIIPASSFDIDDPTARSRINHYSNLRPMWHIDNIRKGNSLDE